MSNIREEYMDWLSELVSDKKHNPIRYQRLFGFLGSCVFRYMLRMDANREEDGIDLRYRFGDEHGYNQAVIATNIDDHPCSMLEMMVALAMRAEENIMDDPKYGNRVPVWFWTMAESLGIDDMTDDRFDYEYVSYIVNRFMEREYAKDGSGGLFTIKHTEHDMRLEEIWYQMCWYLDSIL